MPFNPSWFPSEFAWVLFSIAIASFIIAEIINNFVSLKNRSKEKRERGSLFLIMVGVYFAIFVAFYLRVQNIWIFTNNFQYFGILLMFAGISFREWAIYVLGKGFTTYVKVQKEIKLIKEGPYKLIRNPSYTGGMMTLAGIPIAIGSFLGLIIVLAVIIPVYSYRIKVEEENLIKSYGKRYRDYMEHTYRLIPGY